MQRTLNNQTPQLLGKKVKVSGWVNSVRSHGKLLFVDLRDRSGILQIVFTPHQNKLGRAQAPASDNLYEAAQQLRPEWVISVEGEVCQRPKSMINPKIETGKIELVPALMEIFSQAKTLPFPIDDSGYQINEEIRLKYRYLDLRRERIRKNLVARHEIVRFMRDYLNNEEFIEIETPLLGKSTPEGSRDFLVPSRLEPGKFYALPQSPQQHKQLLQVAGIERYFQIAKCLRDEDPRADRQAEHTQLDIEMSFVEREDVMNLTEKLFIAIVKKLYPEKTIQKIPFPRISFAEAEKKYKTDKPDLRKNKDSSKELAFCWVINFPFFEKDKEGKWTFTHNPFSAPQPKFVEDLLSKNNIEKIITTQYDLVLNGVEIGGGSVRNHRPEALESVFEIMGYQKSEIKEKFGHMLEAFEYGAPPHGGIASGIDRFLSLLLGEPNIREVMAFPKTSDNKDLMMGAPSPVTQKQLEELHIQTIKVKK